MKDMLVEDIGTNTSSIALLDGRINDNAMDIGDLMTVSGANAAAIEILEGTVMTNGNAIDSLETDA